MDANAVGGLISAGQGTATIEIEASGTIVAQLRGAGDAPITIGAVVDASAIGWLTGNGPVSLDGTLVSYATGWMTGTTEDTSVLTAASIADAVWSSVANAYTVEGSTGKIMADIIRLTGNEVTKSGNIITIYESDGVTIWRQYDLSSGGRTLI